MLSALCFKFSTVFTVNHIMPTPKAFEESEQMKGCYCVKLISSDGLIPFSCYCESQHDAVATANLIGQAYGCRSNVYKPGEQHHFYQFLPLRDLSAAEEAAL